MISEINKVEIFHFLGLLLPIPKKFVSDWLIAIPNVIKVNVVMDKKSLQERHGGH